MNTAQGPTLRQVLFSILIGTIAMGLTVGFMELNKFSVNHEDEFRTSFEPVIFSLKQAALNKSPNYGRLSQEALAELKEAPQWVLPSEFALISEGLKAYELHQESVTLSEIALVHLGKFQEKFRYLRIQGRSSFEMGELDAARTAFASAVQLVKDHPDFTFQMQEVNRLAVLIEWIHGELDQPQCDHAHDVYETIKDINGRILNAFSTFVKRATTRYQSACRM